MAYQPGARCLITLSPKDILPVDKFSTANTSAALSSDVFEPLSDPASGLEAL